MYIPADTNAYTWARINIEICRQKYSYYMNNTGLNIAIDMNVDTNAEMHIGRDTDVDMDIDIR